MQKFVQCGYEKFDQVDNALIECQQQQGWDLFIAYFNEQYHVAINFFTEQEEVDTVLEMANAVLVNELGKLELQVLVGMPTTAIGTVATQPKR